MECNAQIAANDYYNGITRAFPVLGHDDVWDYIGSGRYLQLALTCKNFAELYTNKFGTITSRCITKQSAEGGHISVLAWAKTCGAYWGDDLYVHAAEQGRVDVLKWLAANKCPNEEAKEDSCVSTAAAAGGHLLALKWLYDAGFLCDAATFEAAAANGRLNILRWGHCKWAHHQGDMFSTKSICEAAATNAHIHILQWVYSKFGKRDLNQCTCRAAARGGHTHVLTWLKESGCHSNSRGTLVAALRSASLETVMWLVDHLAPSTEGPFYRIQSMSMLAAVETGNVALVKYLIDYGVNGNEERNIAENNALSLTCRQGRLDMFKALCAAGANVNFSGPEKCTPLMWAIRANRPEIVKVIIGTPGWLNVDVVEYWNYSPLMLASMLGHLQVANVLAHAGITRGTHLPIGMKKVVPLTYSDLVDILIPFHPEHGVNWSIFGVGCGDNEDDPYENYLFRAARTGNVGMIRALLDAGALVDTRQYIEEVSRGSPLLVAAKHGNLEAVRILLHAGARITGEWGYLNEEFSDEFTPIAVAAAGGHFLVVKELIRELHDVHTPRCRRILFNGALDVATRRGFVDMMIVLIEALEWVRIESVVWPAEFM